MRVIKMMEKFLKSVVNRLFLTTVILTVLSPSAQADPGIDLLIIDKIQCVKPAGGLDDAALGGFGAVGAAIAGITTAALATKAVVATGGSGAVIIGPATNTMIAKAAAGGAGTAVAAAEFLDGRFSGQDDLIVKVDGKTVLPTRGKFQAINAGQIINPNIKVSFRHEATISLIEYDSGSDNDDIGYITVRGGATYPVENAIVLAPRSEDGSIYYVTYRVLENQGWAQDLGPEYLLCGTNQCDACTYENCARQDYSQLDRDKDKSDLKGCPSGFSQLSYPKYPQTWPAADVYLRVCKRT